MLGHGRLIYVCMRLCSCVYVCVCVYVVSALMCMCVGWLYLFARVCVYACVCVVCVETEGGVECDNMI